MPTLLKKNHSKARIELSYILAKASLKNDIKDPILIGKALVEWGLDELADGFWVWETGTDKEYFSPVFRKTLGFEGEHDFPNSPSSWQNAINPTHAKLALEKYFLHEKSPENEYFLEVEYKKKDGSKVQLYCVGEIINRGESPQIMLGTHEIIP